jgi:hypothetical protein
MKVWLDDRRDPPDGDWVWVTTPAEAIHLLAAGDIEELSLDHDLGLIDEGGREQTGYDVLLWIEEQVATAGLVPPRLVVHSANPPAHERMQRAIDAVNRRAASAAGKGE